MAQHIKRLLTPHFWKIPKKGLQFAVSPRPGPHPARACIPLGIAVRDILKLAETGREVRRLLSAGEVLVDRKKRTDQKLPVGLFDVVEFPKANKHYRVVPSLEGLELKEIKESEAAWKLCQIRGKTTGKGMVQLNLHDGRCILVNEGEAKRYKVSDTLKISLPGQKIEDHMPFRKGAKAVIFAGKNTGMEGAIKEIAERKTMLEKSSVVISAEGKDIRTIKDYVMATGHMAGK